MLRYPKYALTRWTALRCRLSNSMFYVDKLDKLNDDSKVKVMQMYGDEPGHKFDLNQQHLTATIGGFN
jgi:hypothetical protein